MTSRARRAVWLSLAALVAVLAGCGRRGSTAKDELPWLTSLPEALAAAKTSQKPVVADVWATWCGPCLLLAKKSFPNSRVQVLRDRCIWVKVDIDKNEAVAERYGIRSIPTILVLDGDGNELARMTGFRDGDGLADFLEGGLGQSIR